MNSEVLVVGADGCRAGWVVVIASLTAPLTLRSIVVLPSFVALLDATAGCETVGVDMPIGLSDGPPRLADVLARRLLGRRASSVFPPPLRCVLACTSYREACDVAFAASGRRMSKQAFNLTPKIRDVDAALTPELQARVREVHPELAFRALNDGVTPPASKHTVAGLALRAELLSTAFGCDAAALATPRGAARDDLYDACAVAWSAARIARGESVRLPAVPPLDARGLRMEIIY